MKVVVLAGGLGTRLQSVVKDLPKPLAPIYKQKCFLEYLIENFKKQGFKDFIFCVHYMADKIIEKFKDGREFGISIQYSVEKEAMGTAGALGLLSDCINETFCVVNADTYLNLDLNDFYRYHKKRNKVGSMALSFVDNSNRYGLVSCNENDSIEGFEEKNQNSSNGFINAGLYMFEPEIFNYIEKDKFLSIEKDVFPLMVKNKEMSAYKNTRDFIDIGIPEDYDKFKKYIIKSNFDDKKMYINQEINKALQSIKSLENSYDCIEKISKEILDAFQRGNKLLICGNGGSAADAQHITAEFVGKFRYEREALPAISLTTNTSIITAIGNDYSFEDIFSRQVKAIGRKNDILIGISTSGDSKNIIKSFKIAKEMNIICIAFIGKKGALKDLADLILSIDSEETPHIQEAHITAGHIICGMVEKQIFRGGALDDN